MSKGPYRGDQGAIHHESMPGFIFTVTPPAFAKDVASALNTEAKFTEAATNAKRQVIELEQCALFVDSEPLAKAMTDAATFIRGLFGITKR